MWDSAQDGKELQKHSSQKENAVSEPSPPLPRPSRFPRSRQASYLHLIASTLSGRLSDDSITAREKRAGYLPLFLPFSLPLSFALEPTAVNVRATHRSWFVLESRAVMLRYAVVPHGRAFIADAFAVIHVASRACGGHGASPRERSHRECSSSLFGTPHIVHTAYRSHPKSFTPKIVSSDRPPKRRSPTPCCCGCTPSPSSSPSFSTRTPGQRSWSSCATSWRPGGRGGVGGAGGSAAPW